MVTVFIPTPLRKFTEGKSSVDVSAQSVEHAIEGLANQYPDLRQHLFDANNAIRRFIRIFVGDEDINQLNGASTELHPGDKLSIIPANAGGSR